MIPCPTDAWPLLHPAVDSWAGDEHLFDPSDWANHRTYTADPVETEEAYEALDRAFMEVHLLCAGCEREDPVLIDANQLGLPPTCGSSPEQGGSRTCGPHANLGDVRVACRQDPLA